MKNSLNFSKDHELIDIAPITEKYMLLSVYCKKFVHIDYLYNAYEPCVFEVINYTILYPEKYMLLYISTKRSTKQTPVELLLAHSNVLNFETRFLRNHISFKFKEEQLIMVIYDDIIKMLIHIYHFYFLGTLKKAEELTNCLRLQYNFR